MKHPYRDRERFENIAEVYLGGYQWSIACVFRDWLSGRLYGDTDEGCSCFGPFDPNYHAYSGTGELLEITHPRDAADLLDNISGIPSTTQRQDFVRVVRAALAEQP